MKRSKAVYAQLGTVSEGTLRSEDLLPAFLDVAEELRLTRAERATVRRIRRVIDEPLNAHRHGVDSVTGQTPSDELSVDDYWQCGSADDDVDELQDLLSNHAPPFAYFGTLEGDGACFGFWVSQDSLRDATDEGDVWDTRRGEYEPQSTERTWTYRLVVSDHGNMTLHARSGREVWGIV